MAVPGKSQPQQPSQPARPTNPVRPPATPPAQPAQPGRPASPPQQPVKAATSSLAGKYGAKLDAAVQQHAADETTYGVIRLPAGITNGIAQVGKCYFKLFENNTRQKKADNSSAAGEYFFYIEATVHAPEAVLVDGSMFPVKGFYTSKVEPICDTKDSRGNIITQEMHIAEVLNIMRQCAGEEFTHGATINNLEELAKQLEDAAPFIWFSTSPRLAHADGPGVKKGDVVGVWENWNGNRGLENHVPDQPVAFNDQSAAGNNEVASPVVTPPPVSPAPAPRVTTPKPAPRRAPAPAPVIQPDPIPNEPEVVPYNEWTLEELLSLADSNADTAELGQQELTDRALAVGWTQEEIAHPDVTWEQVKVMAENPKTAEEGDPGAVAGDEAAAAAAVIPKTGMTYKYAPPNSRKKGTFLALRDCKVEAVDKTNQTVQLFDLTNKLKYQNVAWAELS